MKIIHSRRKTVALIIENDGNLVIRAPLKVSQKEIEKLILKKADWIRERQAWLQLHCALPHRFIEGELFYYLGNTYPLIIVQRQSQPLIFLNGFRLDCKFLPEVERIFISWYRNQACKILTERVSALASYHQLSYKSIRITSARTRWGSCSSQGTLSFPWRLVMAPSEVIDYIVLHELAHLKYRNHSWTFWKFLEDLYPMYRLQRKWLKEHGDKLIL